MKKIIYKVMTVLFTSILFLSCTKSNEEKLDDRLVGTKWQCRDYVYELFYSGTYYQVLEFISTTTVERYTTHNGTVVDSDGAFTYQLNYPSIVITGERDASYTFTDSRTMVLDGANSSEPYSKYIKQN